MSPNRCKGCPRSIHPLREGARVTIRALLAQALVSGIPYGNYLSGNPQLWSPAQWTQAIQGIEWTDTQAASISNNLPDVLTAALTSENPYAAQYVQQVAQQRIAQDILANPTDREGTAQRVLGNWVAEYLGR